MRKMVLVLVVIFGAIMVHAAELPYLVFYNTSGTATVLSVSNMTLKVDGSLLTVTNDEGSTNFTLTELASMQFSDNTTTIENVIFADQPVAVFSMTGVALGTYTNLNEAAAALSAGSYVISNGNNAQTIVVK